MDLHIVSPDCVAATADEPLRDGEIKKLIAAALSGCGYPAWEHMELSVFRCGGASLIIARPTGAWLPAYTLEFLRRKSDF